MGLPAAYGLLESFEDVFGQVLLAVFTEATGEAAGRRALHAPAAKTCGHGFQALQAGLHAIGVLAHDRTRNARPPWNAASSSWARTALGPMMAPATSAARYAACTAPCMRIASTAAVPWLLCHSSKIWRASRLRCAIAAILLTSTVIVF